MAKWTVRGIGIEKYIRTFEVEAETEEAAREIAERDLEKLSWDYFDRDTCDTFVASIRRLKDDV